jgi:calmodulin
MSDYVANMKSIFKLADKDESGTLERHEFMNILKSVDIDISPFEMEILLSEIDSNNNGLIDFEEFIPVCAELLQVSLVYCSQYFVKKKWFI